MTVLVPAITVNPPRGFLSKSARKAYAARLARIGSANALTSTHPLPKTGHSRAAALQQTAGHPIRGGVQKPVGAEKFDTERFTGTRANPPMRLPPVAALKAVELTGDALAGPIYRPEPRDLAIGVARAADPGESGGSQLGFRVPIGLGRDFAKV